MLHAAMISVGIVVVLVVLLAALRGREVAVKPLRGAHVAGLVVLALLVAAGVDYYVKQQYDAKAAEDGTFAQDQDRQREFFRAVMRELSPFQQGPGKDALDGLIKTLQGGVAQPPAPTAP